MVPQPPVQDGFSDFHPLNWHLALVDIEEFAIYLVALTDFLQGYRIKFRPTEQTDATVVFVRVIGSSSDSPAHARGRLLLFRACA